MSIRVFTHYMQLPIALLLLIEAAAAFLVMKLVVSLQSPFTLLPLSQPVSADVPVVFAGLVVLTQAAMGLYNSRLRTGLLGMLLRLTLAAVASLAVLWLLLLLLPGYRMSLMRYELALAIVITANLLLRQMVARVLPAEVFRRRVLVYGAGRQAQSINSLRRRSDRIGFQIVAYVPAEGEGSPEVEPTVIDSGALLEYCRTHDVDEIVVAMDDRRRAFPVHDLLQCRLQGIDIIELLSFLERETGKVYLDVLHPSWMIFSEGFRRSPWRESIGTLLDILAGILVIAVTWPLMLLTIVSIKMEDGWRAPVLYRQQRVGRMGRKFDMLKFRSMGVDAEADGIARWAETGDTRVTWVGRLTRKLRIDELPQLFNVLKGDMRFVGPRPERPEFVQQLSDQIPYYSERHIVAPGMTGWAQLCYSYGSSESDAAEKLQYDLYYIKNRNVFFDLAILVQTVEVILFGKGAR